MIYHLIHTIMAHKFNDPQDVLEGVAIRWRRAVIAQNQWKAVLLMAWYRKLKGESQMKNVLVALMLALSLAVVAKAETLNPDKYPSMGFNWTHAGLSGDSSAQVMGIGASESITGSSNLLISDLRYPVSNNWTLSAQMGLQFANQNGTSAVSSSDVSYHGLVTGLGVRYYFIGK